MNKAFKNMQWTAGLLLCCATVTAQQHPEEYTLKIQARNMDSKAKTYYPWNQFKTRTIETLQGFKPKTTTLSKYGGRTDKKLNATGFFTATKEQGRWWLADPEGNAFVNVGMVNVQPGESDNEKTNMQAKYGGSREWTEATHKLLVSNGFNALGAWSNVALFSNDELEKTKPVAYTIIKNFMSDYGQQRGGVYQESGHMGYPDRTIFVFDPAFEAFCDKYASQLAVNKDDKNLFGYFSDNELPFERQTLDRYLDKKDTADPGYVAAWAWMKERNLTKEALNDTVRSEFLGLVAEKYYSVVSKAIKKYDPNHLYLGSRLHSWELKSEPFFRTMGKYVDVIAINYYRVWTPVAEDMKHWEEWSGKPFMVTEWYTKGEDSGMPNYSGAGWIVRTQNDRGLFYQNFALALLEAKSCVGFQWFKYQDNDPDNQKVDPSNTDANKGIVNTRYETYQPLLDKMKELNTNVYSLIDFFDSRNK